MSTRTRHSAALLVWLLVFALAAFAIACGSPEQASESEVEVVEKTEPDRPAAQTFDLPSANTGEQVSLTQFRGEQPVVLVFYRAYW